MKIEDLIDFSTALRFGRNDNERTEIKKTMSKDAGNALPPRLRGSKTPRWWLNNVDSCSPIAVEDKLRRNDKECGFRGKPGMTKVEIVEKIRYNDF